MSTFATFANHLRGLATAFPLLCLASAALASSGKPNIPVGMGDDIGITDISAYSHRITGYTTPNIDCPKDPALIKLGETSHV